MCRGEILKLRHPVKRYQAEYGAWYQMVRRCTAPSCPSFRDYGAKGVTVDARWLGRNGFDSFVDDMGPRPSIHHSLDRIDVLGGYTPTNCRWATRAQQARNTRKTHHITLDGVTKPFKDWAAHFGLRDSLVHTRINKLGWPIEKAFKTPVAKVDQASARYPEQAALNEAIQRCHNPRNPAYPNYGGRGIFVAPAWRGRGGLKAFVASVGKHPGIGYSLERIDVNGNYVPGNCRWATRQEQVNNRRVTKKLTYEGTTRTYAEWARIIGINEHAIRWRIAAGWPLARVLSQTPIQARRAAVMLP